MKNITLTLATFVLVFVVFFVGTRLFTQKVFKPNPEVVHVESNDLNTSLTDYKMQVTGSVVNKGATGYVTVCAVLIQDGKKWEKNQKVYIESGEMAPFQIQFPEVKLLASQPTFQVKAY